MRNKVEKKLYVFNLNSRRRYSPFKFVKPWAVSYEKPERINPHHAVIEKFYTLSEAHTAAMKGAYVVLNGS